MSLEDVVARLEAATEGSRRFDVEIAVAALGWKLWRSKRGYWVLDGPNDEHVTSDWPPPKFDPDTGEPNAAYDVPPLYSLAERGDFPLFTTSLDAAMTLIPGGGWDHIRLLFGPPGGWNAEVGYWHVGEGNIDPLCAGAHETGPLALCIACLRAKAASA